MFLCLFFTSIQVNEVNTLVALNRRLNVDLLDNKKAFILANYSSLNESLL